MASQDFSAQDVSTSVYRYYDASSILIYVGITSRGGARNQEHNSTKTWWPYVVRQEVDHCPSRSEAEAIEKELIRSFRPPFNTQHNVDTAKTRDAYIAFALSRPLAPIELLRLSKNHIELDVLSFTPVSAVLRTPLTSDALVNLIQIGDDKPTVNGVKLGRVIGIAKDGPRIRFDLSGARFGAVQSARAYVVMVRQKPPVVLAFRSITIEKAR